MSKHVDFYFDFGSPTAYLAWTQLPGIAQAAGAELRLHPILMRGAVGYQMHKPEAFDAYVAAIYRAMWAEGLNLGDQAVLAEVLQRAGFDAQEFLALIQDPAVKDRLRAETEAAVERGIFGAPTMFVGDDMYFGQDRRDFAREALQ